MSQATKSTDQPPSPVRYGYIIVRLKPIVVSPTRRQQIAYPEGIYHSIQKAKAQLDDLALRVTQQPEQAHWKTLWIKDERDDGEHVVKRYAFQDESDEGNTGSVSRGGIFIQRVEFRDACGQEG